MAEKEPKKRKRGRPEERLKIEEDPEKALEKLFHAKRETEPEDKEAEVETETEEEGLE